MPIAQSHANTLLDDTFVSQAVEFRLHNGDPGAAGTANEVDGSGNGYAPVTGEFSTNAASGSVSSDADMVWSDMPEVTVSWVSVWESGTTPVFLWRAELDSSVALPSGATFIIESGDATFSIT
jgi:hypothetical protein